MLNTIKRFFRSLRPKLAFYVGQRVYCFDPNCVEPISKFTISSIEFIDGVWQLGLSCETGFVGMCSLDEVFFTRKEVLSHQEEYKYRQILDWALKYSG